MSRHPGLRRESWFLLATLLFPLWVGALPGPGETMPSFGARDLLDTPHQSRDWRGHRTLVVAITDPDSADEMRRWFDAADGRIPKAVHRASILSFDLPFFVSVGMARTRARDQVPQRYWSDTWLDRDGKMAKTLGLASSRTPYVLALDEHGKVLASVHGTVDSTDASSIWKALAGGR